MIANAGIFAAAASTTDVRSTTGGTPVVVAVRIRLSGVRRDFSRVSPPRPTTSATTTNPDQAANAGPTAPHLREPRPRRR
ncbi:hypothetical protein [Saccharothrix xinjiangensis]|uniref:Uncharacterized protein n=1 Tax=Saccharothrix xinjiangensis TaxID=204798 RepID=A0ABV9XVF8_9PSEU